MPKVPEYNLPSFNKPKTEWPKPVKRIKVPAVEQRPRKAKTKLKDKFLIADNISLIDHIRSIKDEC